VKSRPDRDEVVALIPALDEEEALPGVLEELARAGIGRILVVDNGSRDGTARVARAAGACVIQEPEKGYGAACQTGIAEILGWDPSPGVILFLDGDGSDDPAAAHLLLDPLARDEADFVVGVRIGTGHGGHAVPLHASLGNSLVRGGARLLHGARLADLGPFRAIRLATLLELEMDDRNWGWTLQMQLRAHHLGVRYREVPVPHRERRGGRSKVSGSLTGSIRAGGKMLWLLLTELRQARRFRSGNATSE